MRPGRPLLPVRRAPATAKPDAGFGLFRRVGLLRNAGADGDADFLREGAEVLSQSIVMEAAQRITAAKY